LCEQDQKAKLKLAEKKKAVADRAAVARSRAKAKEREKRIRDKAAKDKAKSKRAAERSAKEKATKEREEKKTGGKGGKASRAKGKSAKFAQDDYNSRTSGRKRKQSSAARESQLNSLLMDEASVTIFASLLSTAHPYPHPPITVRYRCARRAYQLTMRVMVASTLAFVLFIVGLKKGRSPRCFRFIWVRCRFV
jgi:hypothetical protein